MALRGRSAQGRQPPARLQRRQASRWETERRRQRLALAVGAAALVLILTTLALGYMTTSFLPPRAVAATVNGVAITNNDLLKGLRVVQVNMELSGFRVDLGTTRQVLDTMVENEVIRQVVPSELGISVSDNEVEEEMRTLLLGLPDDEGEQDPAAREAEFQQQLRQYLDLTRFSEEEFQSQARAVLLRERAMEVVGADVPTAQPQAHLFRLSVAGQETVDLVRQMAGEGTPFEELVEQFEVGEASKAVGGEVGWMPRGLLGDQADMIFGLDVGVLSEAVPDPTRPDAFTLFMVKDKEEARELEPARLEQLKQQALVQWLQEKLAEQNVVSQLSSSGYDWLAEQLQRSSLVQASPVR